MRPCERRDLEKQSLIAAGDPRAILLVGTPPAERSEVAARYDHAAEAVDLDGPSSPTDAELDTLRVEIWRGNVAIELAEHGGYLDGTARYLSGARVSAGLARSIANAEASTPFPTLDEARAVYEQTRRFRRDYLRQRYGI